MLVDITLKITPEMMKQVFNTQTVSFSGHIGTHFDVMDKEFPLEYTKRKGIVFDVSSISNRDIECTDIDLTRVEKDMFVMFYSGMIERVEYGTRSYFKEHPQLSHELIDVLIKKGISMIGIDFSGVRRGSEHTPKDQLCANHGIFVIENLCNLKSLLDTKTCTVHTYPLHMTQMTGLPCRVVAEIEKGEC
ncbi:MAG: cyclase family protein [Erysipelotrichaceae bacterium]|nr:cyclase family protein [Erysipelotrichaceae bacterium]